MAVLENVGARPNIFDRVFMSKSVRALEEVLVTTNECINDTQKYRLSHPKSLNYLETK